MGRYIRAGKLFGHLLAYTTARQKTVQSAHLSFASPAHHLDANASVLSNRAIKLGLSCKANNYSDARTGDLAVLTIQEISPYRGRWLKLKYINRWQN